jgi:DNA (cytosine-5)-methyltransferase 1
MGFDRPGEQACAIPVSDTQAYKQFGNAVVVPVVEAVARHIQPWLEQAVKGSISQGAFQERNVA